MDWSQEERSLRKNKQSVFFTAVHPMYAREDLEEVQYDLDKPDSQCTKILGTLTKIQYINGIWSSLKEKDCSCIKLDHMQSLFSTHHLRFVLRNWYTWRLERNHTARYINHQGYRVLHSRLIRDMDVRIHLIPMRENPPTIKANSVCARKPVAHFSRTHVNPRESAMSVQRNLSR